MKKLSLVAALSCMASMSFAQKGSYIVLGNVGYNATHASDSSGGNSSRSIVVFNPAVGYQVSERWAIGIVGQLQRNGGTGWKTSVPGKVKSSSLSVGGGIFARCTLPVSDLFFVAIQNQLVYFSSSGNINGVASPIRSNYLSLDVTPNIGMRIAKGYAVNLSFGNLTATTGSDNVGSSNYGINTNFGSGVMFGFTKNFAGHRKTAGNNG